MNARKSQPLPRKHVPQRTCIACRRVQGKRSLIRLVRTATSDKATGTKAVLAAEQPGEMPGAQVAAAQQAEPQQGEPQQGEPAARVVVDSTGKLSGRGCYLHPNQQCWQNALKSGKIEQALKARLSAEERAQLAAYAATLPVSEELPELPSGSASM